MRQTLTHIYSWLANRFSFRKPVKRAMWAGLLFAAVAGGCGNDPAACDQCTIEVIKADESLKLSCDATFVCLPSAMSTSAPIQFIVRGPNGDPVPGARLVFYTAGNALALVANDRYTVYAVDALTYTTYNAAKLDLQSYFSLDFTLVDAGPIESQRGIWETVTNDHGEVDLIPVGILPGCPALPPGGDNLKYAGFAGVTALISDTNNGWSMTWEVECVAPPVP